MSVKIALLGFGTVASGVPFLLKENHEKISQAAQDDIEIAKVLVRDDAEKQSLQAAGHDYNFVTNVDEIIEDKDIAIVVELMGRIEPAKTFITRALEAGKHVVLSLIHILMAEFFEPDLPVTLVAKDKSTVVMTVKELLPYSFTDLT